MLLVMLLWFLPVMCIAEENVFKRPLPSTGIDFRSEEGKRMFKESLADGNAEIFFKLASQFRTQDELSYCGLGTMVMVLNSLDVDPKRVWKAPWRFYHESMLDCCTPLDVVNTRGINIQEFACLARCERLDTKLVYASMEPSLLERFRKDVFRSVRSENEILVVNYGRPELGETGISHYSPLAAYHAASDKALLMDVARFKYPPHWVSLSELQYAMQAISNTTFKPRGYLTMTVKPDSQNTTQSSYNSRGNSQLLQHNIITTS